MDIQRISHVWVKMSDGTSKQQASSQATKKIAFLSLQSTKLVEHSSM
jgi:hypothetical protein